MIVKNESKVIGRCLASVREIIDYWVIVDTGSTDGTQEIIRSYLEDIPGSLYERPWVNFEQNRNEALNLARGKADYIFFIDADEVLRLNKPLNKEKLTAAFYAMKSVGRDTEHHRIHLIGNDPGWKWVGVLHEAIIHEEKIEGKILQDAIIDFTAMDGNRFNDPDKFLNDAKVLEKALKKDPSNPRYVFYLAQSYFNARRYPKALENFQKRLTMRGEDGEAFFSLYCIGYIQEEMKIDSETVVGSYLKAFEFKPMRAEPLERLAQFFCKKNWPLLGYLISKFGLNIQTEMDFNSHALPWVYDYSLELIFADSAYAIRAFNESLVAYHHLQENAKLPEHYLSHVKRRIADH